MRLLSVFLLFLAADAKRKKRGRVRGGTKVRSATKYPSYVAMLRFNQHYCGGSILDETTILTAAHCKPRTSDLVAFGTNKRAEHLSSSEKRTNTVGIKSVKLLGRKLTGSSHSKWDEKIWDNDWAIVKLAKPIPLGRTAAKAELATWKEFEENLLNGSNNKCTIIGNGITDVKGQFSEVLKEGTVTFVSESPKTSGFRTIWNCNKRSGKNCLLFRNSNRAIVGAGDSGGPIFCKGEGGKMKTYGVASWASKDGKSDDNTLTMGFAPVFSPDAQKHFGQWNPQNRPPNASTFKGFDELMNHMFFPEKMGPFPQWAKVSGSSSRTKSSSSSSSRSSYSSGGRSSSSGYSRGSYGNQRSSGSLTGSSYKRPNSSSQASSRGNSPECTCPQENKPSQAPQRKQYRQPSYARNSPSRSSYSGSSSSNNRYPSRKPMYNSRNSAYAGNSRSYNSGSGSRNFGNSGSRSNSRPNYGNRMSGQYRG
ncbi:Oidioi.mRNA.OKI2018_I69.chr1.g1426.t1.cds [Oikopleura dioica]|uniref:Oidioi.mRNA.OKI2018_I69.chr1.g1426.t1.cds n=1 Tax=Oikopleura dioica TaxID=34765 RepID=A0ABN7SS51_OIKDI|nr:Oidioi.mRNA.OKI2018_I69.chr1.g1426.t1.cds [Oikopleura dioica]